MNILCFVLGGTPRVNGGAFKQRDKLLINSSRKLLINQVNKTSDDEVDDDMNMSENENYELKQL